MRVSPERYLGVRKRAFDARGTEREKAHCEEQCAPCGTWKELRAAGGDLWGASHLLRSEAWQGKLVRSSMCGRPNSVSQLLR